MGTRADFYVGRGEQAEWVGSIAWDGYPDGISKAVLKAKTEPLFRSALEAFLAPREDTTRPEQGWPWPWENSHLTDYSYAFEAGQVWACCFGHKWYSATDPALNDDETEGKETVFPDMTSRQNVTLGKRSGVMVFTAPKG